MPPVQPGPCTDHTGSGRCHSKPQTGVAFICRRLSGHLRERGCLVSAGPPLHPPHSPPPHHPPTSSSPMASPLHHPPHTHTAPHNPHPHYTPTPSPLHDPPHSTAVIPLPLHHPAPHHRPPARTRCSCHLWDMLSLPGVLWIPCSRQKHGCPVEYPGVAGRKGGRELPKGWVQVGGAEDALCPASSHCPSWRAAHPAQGTSA